MEAHPDPILIVEDSEVSRTMLVLLFEKAGYEVVAHADGDEALADIIARPFSMLLLDQQLPGKTGIELLEADRKHNRNTPAIFVTGNLDLNDAVKISHLGIAGIFTKPADPVALLKKAREIAFNTNLEQPEETELEQSLAQSAKAEPEPALERPPPPTDKPAYPTKEFPAVSTAFIELTHSLWKFRNFRTALLLNGPEGTLYEEIARDMHASSDWAQGSFLVYNRSILDADSLLDLLAHALVEEKPSTVLIPAIHELDSEGQELLRKAVGFEETFMPFAQRVRFVLTSDVDLTLALDDGTFDESLYFRIGSVTATVPTYLEMKEDVLPLARHFLETFPRTGDYKHPLILANDTVGWLQSQDWTDRFADIKYLVANLVHFATRREVSLELVVNVCQLIDADSAPTREELAQAAADKIEADRSRPAPPVKTNAATENPQDEPKAGELADEPSPETTVRQGVASYLPSELTSAEIEAAISSSTTTRSRVELTGKRDIQRKKPGSYDFNKRLSEMLSEDS